MSSSRWDLWRSADGDEEILFKGPGGVPDWWLRTDRDFAAGELVQRPTDPPLPIRADGHPLLEYVVVRLLGQRGGLLLHASTAIVGDRAFVFVGHSGAGKSTMARIAEAAGARIPTDDRTLFTIDEGGVWAWGTPWHGSLERKSPERARTAGIFLLEQSSENSAVQLPADQGVMELFVRLVQPRLASQEVKNTLGALQAIAARVPLFRLRFTRSAQGFETAMAAAAGASLSNAGEGGMAPFLQPVPMK